MIEVGLLISILSGYSIIIHYLPRTRKPQFIPRDPFNIGRVILQRMDSLPEVVIVSFQEGDFLGKCIILLLHPVVFYQSHLTENKRRQKISCKEDARSDKQPLP